MSLVRFIRHLTLAMMALSLLAGLYRPEIFETLWPIFRWLIPAWIVLLFVVHAFAYSEVAEASPLEMLWSRLRGRGWQCPRCGKRYGRDVAICVDCAELRPDPPWLCSVCSKTNRPEVRFCGRCNTPRPKGR